MFVLFLVPLNLAVAEFYSSDLAGDGLRQFFNELDCTRILVWCRRGLDMRLQFADSVIRTGPAVFEADECLDNDTANRVRTSDISGFLNTRVRH